LKKYPEQMTKKAIVSATMILPKIFPVSLNLILFVIFSKFFHGGAKKYQPFGAKE